MFSFQVTGVDYAGPLFYRSKTRNDLKAYIILLSCSASRAVYKELVPNLTTSEFIKCLKRLIARSGRPKIIFSDNAKTFKAGPKLLQKIRGKIASPSKSRTNNLKIQYYKNPMVGGQYTNLLKGFG